MRALSSKKSSILSRIKTTDFQSSTKIEALREEVHKMLQADPSAKAIVFSQFTSMLDLVSFRLEQVQQYPKKTVSCGSIKPTHDLHTAYVSFRLCLLQAQSTSAYWNMQHTSAYWNR